MITAIQFRMARAGLKLSVDDLASISLVSKSTITRFENGGEITPVMKQALVTALEKSGAAFKPDGVYISSDTSQ